MFATKISTTFQFFNKYSRNIITRVPETSTELYNSFSIYPPARQYFGNEIGMFVKLTPDSNCSKPLSQRYFNKPIINYKTSPPPNNLIKYKPHPHDHRKLPLSMRWFNQP